MTLSEQDKERFAGFVAIRCASQVAKAQVALAQIVGDTASAKRSLEKEAWIELPQFMVLDLVGDYVIGEQRVVYKGNIRSCHAQLFNMLT